MSEQKPLHEWKDWLGRRNRVVELADKPNVSSAPPITKHEFCEHEGMPWVRSMAPSTVNRELARLSSALSSEVAAREEMKRERDALRSSLLNVRVDADNIAHLLRVALASPGNPTVVREFVGGALTVVTDMTQPAVRAALAPVAPRGEALSEVDPQAAGIRGSSPGGEGRGERNG